MEKDWLQRRRASASVMMAYECRAIDIGPENIEVAAGGGSKVDCTSVGRFTSVGCVVYLEGDMYMLLDHLL